MKTIFMTDRFSLHEQKIVFQELFGTFFRIELSSLEAEIH